MSHVVVRIANQADVPALFDIRLAVRENAMTMAEMAKASITPETVREAITSTSRAWIALIDEKPAAFAMANNVEGTIFAVFVHPDFEGRGLGARLMDEAERYLFEHHQAIWLTTGNDPSIRAHGFYASRGWRSVGAANASELRYEKERA